MSWSAGPSSGPSALQTANNKGMASIKGRAYVGGTSSAPTSNNSTITIQPKHNSKEVRGFGGEVRCIDGRQKLTIASAREFMNDVYSAPMIVGFGAVWKPTSRTAVGTNPCAVLQIATAGRVWLFRICRFPDGTPSLPICVKHLLNDPQVLKVEEKFHEEIARDKTTKIASKVTICIKISLKTQKKCTRNSKISF